MFFFVQLNQRVSVFIDEPQSEPTKKRKQKYDESTSTSKKLKNAGCEDDQLPTEQQPVGESLPSKKRKQKQTETDIAPKKQKTADVDNLVCEDEQHPTEEQLQESEKPENQPDLRTVRQKKKKRHQKNVVMQMETSANKEINKNAEYLTKWKQDKTQWKFEKLRQISIQNTCLDESKMTDEIWEIAAEYLSGTKGAAKSKLCEMAESTIDKLDEEIQKTNDKSLIVSASYKRARELLQSLD